MTLAARVIGDGPPVLFLHGLGATSSYWGGAFDRLAASHRLTFVDLAGFGRSAAIDGPYDFDGHVARLAPFRSPGVTLVGHSFGALLALAAAAEWRDVGRVVAFGLPAFLSADEAREQMSNLGAITRWMTGRSPAARAACWLTCHSGPVAERLAPLLARHVPPEVARAAVRHRWESYEGSYRALIEDTDVRRWVTAAACPVTVVQGKDDRVCPPALVMDVLAGLDVDVRTRPGDHHLPLRAPDACVQDLEAILMRPTPPFRAYTR